MKGSVSIEWQGESLDLLPDRAVYWPKEKTLYIADTHFGKAATFRKVGIPVSEHTTAEDCQRLSKLVEGTGAEKLIILGDFLHARAGRAQPVRNQLFDWRDQHKELSIILIRGNHDQQSGDPWPELDIECMADPTEAESWDLRHLPVESPTRPYYGGTSASRISIEWNGTGYTEESVLGCWRKTNHFTCVWWIYRTEKCHPRTR